MSEAAPVLSGKFKITNISQAPRILYNATGQATVINPGQSVVMFITESDEKFIRRSKFVELNVAADDVEITVQRANEPVERPQYVARTATELLDYIKKNKASYPQWMPTAKHILGEKWPGGMPKQAAITKLLRERAKDGE